jgi:uroporphyrinogen-III decarboxylase
LRATDAAAWHLAELPKGRVPMHFDRVDRDQAHKFLAGRNCFWGNIPVSLMEHGTPQQVEEDVRRLIDTFAGDCGLVIDSAGCITDDTRAENVAAMVEAVRKYGVR